MDKRGIVKEHSDIFYDLITNSKFRDWVQHPSADRDRFWEKWLEEYPENIAELKKAREFLGRMQFREGQLSPSEVANIWGKVMAHTERGRKPIITIDSLWMLLTQPLKVAAILLISLLAAMILSFETTVAPQESPSSPSEWTTLENPKGRKSKITLPDGTQVYLSYESQLRFPVAFEKNTRQVELVGEAYFEVVHNNDLPFVVATAGVETEVLGTSFNIKSYNEDMRTEISLISGKVKIKKQDKNHLNAERYLVPGEQFTYSKNSGEMVVRSFEEENVLAWKEDIIYFKDAGLDEFVDQLERWYGVDIQVFGVPSKEWKINARYQSQSLEEILTGMDFVYGIEYKISGKNVILKLM